MIDGIVIRARKLGHRHLRMWIDHKLRFLSCFNGATKSASGVEETSCSFCCYAWFQTIDGDSWKAPGSKATAV